jgi:hypothetical protein
MKIRTTEISNQYLLLIKRYGIEIIAAQKTSYWAAI